jgi:hypothetical protein
MKSTIAMRVFVWLDAKKEVSVVVAASVPVNPLRRRCRA